MASRESPKIRWESVRVKSTLASVTSAPAGRYSSMPVTLPTRTPSDRTSLPGRRPATSVNSAVNSSLAPETGRVIARDEHAAGDREGREHEQIDDGARESGHRGAPRVPSAAATDGTARRTTSTVKTGPFGPSGRARRIRSSRVAICSPLRCASGKLACTRPSSASAVGTTGTSVEADPADCREAICFRIRNVKYATYALNCGSSHRSGAVRGLVVIDPLGPRDAVG